MPANRSAASEQVQDLQCTCCNSSRKRIKSPKTFPSNWKNHYGQSIVFDPGIQVLNYAVLVLRTLNQTRQEQHKTTQTEKTWID